MGNVFVWFSLLSSSGTSNEYPKSNQIIPSPLNPVKQKIFSKVCNVIINEQIVLCEALF